MGCAPPRAFREGATTDLSIEGSIQAAELRIESASEALTLTGPTSPNA
jgi:hypothetical protein